MRFENNLSYYSADLLHIILDTTRFFVAGKSTSSSE
jgi:hypothetical protein